MASKTTPQQRLNARTCAHVYACACAYDGVRNTYVTVYSLLSERCCSTNCMAGLATLQLTGLAYRLYSGDSGSRIPGDEDIGLGASSGDSSLFLAGDRVQFLERRRDRLRLRRPQLQLRLRWLRLRLRRLRLRRPLGLRLRRLRRLRFRPLGLRLRRPLGLRLRRPLGLRLRRPWRLRLRLQRPRAWLRLRD